MCVMQVVKQCMSLHGARPTFEWIAAKLRKMSHFFEKNGGQANISMV